MPDHTCANELPTPRNTANGLPPPGNMAQDWRANQEGSDEARASQEGRALPHPGNRPLIRLVRTPRKTRKCRIPPRRGSGAVIFGPLRWHPAAASGVGGVLRASWSDGPGTAPVSASRRRQGGDVAREAPAGRSPRTDPANPRCPQLPILACLGRPRSPPATMQDEERNHQPCAQPQMPKRPRALSRPGPPTPIAFWPARGLKRSAPGDQTRPLSECHRSWGQGGRGPRQPLTSGVNPRVS